jgi:hypothetical protein
MMYNNGGFRLVIRRGPQPNQVYELNQDMMTLGRDVNNEITVNDPEVSRHHCRLTRGPNGYTLEDLGSTNGTFVNGRRLTGAQPLNVGDLIGLGETVTLAYETSVGGGASPGGSANLGGQQQAAPAPQQGYGGGYQTPGTQDPQGGYYQQQAGPYPQQAGYGPPAAQQIPPYYPEDEARGNRGCGIFIGCGIFVVLLLVGWIVAIVVIDTPLDDVRGVNDAANAIPLPGSSVDNVNQYLDALIGDCDVEAASEYVCSAEEDFHDDATNFTQFCAAFAEADYDCQQDGNDVTCDFTIEGLEPDDITFNIRSGLVCGFVEIREPISVPDTTPPTEGQ